MEKLIKVLIGDNSVELGMAFSKYLRKLGIDTLCRRNNIRLLYNEIAEEKPDFVILSIASPDINEIDFIKRLKSDFPKIKIIAVSYISSPKLRRRIIMNGAERCILMPVSMNELYAALEDTAGYKKLFEFDSLLLEFLISIGVKSHINGFRYLSAGVGFIIIDPDLTSDITGALYKKIADACNVEPSHVERSLRHVSVMLHSSGADKALVGEEAVRDRRLTNYELICAVADAFAKEYGIFD